MTTSMAGSSGNPGSARNQCDASARRLRLHSGEQAERASEMGREWGVGNGVEDGGQWLAGSRVSGVGCWVSGGDSNVPIPRFPTPYSLFPGPGFRPQVLSGIEPRVYTYGVYIL